MLDLSKLYLRLHADVILQTGNNRFPNLCDALSDALADTLSSHSDDGDDGGGDDILPHLIIIHCYTHRYLNTSTAQHKNTNGEMRHFYSLTVCILNTLISTPLYKCDDMSHLTSLYLLTDYIQHSPTSPYRHQILKKDINWRRFALKLNHFHSMVIDNKKKLYKHKHTPLPIDRELEGLLLLSNTHRGLDWEDRRVINDDNIITLILMSRLVRHGRYIVTHLAPENLLEVVRCVGHTQVAFTLPGQQPPIPGVGDKVREMGDKVREKGDMAGEEGDKVREMGEKAGEKGDKVREMGEKAGEEGDKVRDKRDEGNNKGYKIIETGDAASEKGDKVKDKGEKALEKGDKMNWGKNIDDKSKERGLLFINKDECEKIAVSSEKKRGNKPGRMSVAERLASQQHRSLTDDQVVVVDDKVVAQPHQQHEGQTGNNMDEQVKRIREQLAAQSIKLRQSVGLPPRFQRRQQEQLEELRRQLDWSQHQHKQPPHHQHHHQHPHQHHELVDAGAVEPAAVAVPEQFTWPFPSTTSMASSSSSSPLFPSSSTIWSPSSLMSWYTPLGTSSLAASLGHHNHSEEQFELAKQWLQQQNQHQQFDRQQNQHQQQFDEPQAPLQEQVGLGCGEWGDLTPQSHPQPIGPSSLPWGDSTILQSNTVKADDKPPEMMRDPSMADTSRDFSPFSSVWANGTANGKGIDMLNLLRDSQAWHSSFMPGNVTSNNINTASKDPWKIDLDNPG